MLGAFARYGLTAPTWKSIGGGTMVTVYLKEDLKEDLKESLSPIQRRILEIIRSNKNITQKELSLMVGINEKNTRNNIATLKNKGLLQRIGGRKQGYWEVVL